MSDFFRLGSSIKDVLQFLTLAVMISNVCGARLNSNGVNFNDLTETSVRTGLQDWLVVEDETGNNEKDASEENFSSGSVQPRNLAGIETCGILDPPSNNTSTSRVRRHTIIGGRLSDRFAPWMVGIYKKVFNYSLVLCGGALIRTNFVMTAGHCFIRTNDPEAFEIRVGMRDAMTLEGKEMTFNFERIVTNPKYQPPVPSFDVTIIKLKENVLSFNPRAKLLCLPDITFTHDKTDGKTAIVAGWGTTSFAGHESRYLRELSIPMVTNTECDIAFRKLRTYKKSFNNGLTEEFICAGFIKGGHDACQGDSGGPLMMEVDGRWTAIGVVSTGYKCAYPGYYGIYTRTTSVLDFIYSQINS